MNYITSNVPYFKAWVRREYTTNHDRYHGEFLHAMVIGVTTLPMRTMSFQVLFTGCAKKRMYTVVRCGHVCLSPLW